MAWSQQQLAQMARAAGEQAARAVLSGGGGQLPPPASLGSGGSGLGSKGGIPNWNCRCGTKSNFGTRATCRNPACAAEAPKRILKLQAEKGIRQGTPTPTTTPPSTPRANLTGGPGTPSLRPSTPRQTGLNSPNPAAQGGAWGTAGAAGA